MKNIITIVWEKENKGELTFHAEYSCQTLDWFLSGIDGYHKNVGCAFKIDTNPHLDHRCIDRMVNAKLLFDSIHETKKSN